MPPIDVEIAWEVAADPAFSQLVKSGRTLATPEYAHSAHVEVGGLRPRHWYWYRFRVGNSLSPVGRTQTLPDLHDEVDRLSFAFVSCQNYQAGHYTAYRHLTREKLDLIIHLGDYIYETGISPGAVRPHNSGELSTLSDYRNRYALYKMDPDLQAAHAAFPWIVTWDDHEVDDNYAGIFSEDNEHVATFLARRANAYKAYYEHMPLRSIADPQGSEMQLYRDFSWGKLAKFWVLDTRQYRTDQPCGDNPGPRCAEAFSQDGTMLGDTQERWLFDGLANSPSRWNVIAQQVLLADIDFDLGPDDRYFMDKWSGYPIARDRFLKFLHQMQPKNPVIITGDAHDNWVNDIKLDFLDFDSPTVATEFVGTSISSGRDGSNWSDSQIQEFAAENPFVKFINRQRGYVRCTIAPDVFRCDFRVLEYVTLPDSPISTRASFLLEHDVRGARDLAKTIQPLLQMLLIDE